MSTTLDPALAVDDMLRFVWAQSYDKTFGETLATRAADPDRAPGLDPAAAAIPLEADLHAALDAVPYPIDWSRRGRAAVTPQAVQALLYNAVGLLRREPRNAYNDHRAFPSPRSLFPTHAYYLHADEAGSRAYHYDPIAHALRPIAAGAPRALRGDGVIALASHYTHIPDYYRSLRYTLGLLEIGHCLYGLALVARALGLTSRAVLAFDDDAMLRRLRLEPEDGWTVPVLVELGSAGDATLRDPVRPVRRAHVPDGNEAASVDRACWLEGPDERRAWSRLVAAPPAAAPAHAVALGDFHRPDPQASVAQVLFDRNAGRGIGGVSARLGTIPLHVVSSALREGFRGLDSDLTAGPGWSQVGMRVLLAAERVADLEDGVYEVFPEEQALAPLTRGRVLGDVQRAFPPGLHIDTYNLAWFFVLDYPRIVGQRGPRGFRIANLELGWAAQAISCALAANGLFARPCRSYHEGVLDATLGLSPAESVGYALVCGVNRFHDIRLDLRC